MDTQALMAKFDFVTFPSCNEMFAPFHLYTVYIYPQWNVKIEPVHILHNFELNTDM